MPVSSAHNNNRHLDRSGGQSHRPPRSGEIPAFRLLPPLNQATASELIPPQTTTTRYHHPDMRTSTLAAQNPAMPNQNPYLGLMLAAKAHAKAHGAQTPVLSPDEAVLLSHPPQLDVASLH
ncbi:MAG: hypothetical protein ABI286_12840, partial [Edaphobacter sp.]